MFCVICVRFGDPVIKVVEVVSAVFGTLERQRVPGSAVWGVQRVVFYFDCVWGSRCGA